MAPLSSARRAAFEILRRVESEGAYASLMLAAIDPRMRDDDRALCHELVLGVLRRQLWLDRTLAHFANRRMEKLDLGVRLALRLGLYQLRFLSRIPASAAVNESVNLVHAAGLKSAASFANAVLRRATREPNYDPATTVSDPIERIMIETSHPRWLIERWTRTFGLSETEALAQANNEPAPVAFRLTAKTFEGADGRALMANLATADVELQPSQIAPDSWRVAGKKSAPLRELAHAGQIYFQDEASQLVTHLLGAQPDEIILDACAAPGSKTTHIAALSPRTTIIANELHQHRIKVLREAAAVQGAASIRLVVGDAAGNLPFRQALFDRVLVDAPCSGTGTLRRNPEIRWRLNETDIAKLAEKQRRLLANAAEMTRAGGTLLYSTCSIEQDENEDVVRDVLRNHSDFEQVIPETAARLLTNTGALRTWPHRHDVDGFFMMLFRRRR